MRTPIPTPIFRLTHVDNLSTLLERRQVHAPNHVPDDGLPYQSIHDIDVQATRRITVVPCGPGGNVHDYVAFYFGPRSPMLYRLHTGRVDGFRGGQRDLVYLVSTAQAVDASRCSFVFTDAHALANFRHWFDDLAKLRRVDWQTVYAERWNNTLDDPDRQRRKQAEFLVHRRMPLSLIERIGVLDQRAQARVAELLATSGSRFRPAVEVQPAWYY